MIINIGRPLAGRLIGRYRKTENSLVTSLSPGRETENLRRERNRHRVIGMASSGVPLREKSPFTIDAS